MQNLFDLCNKTGASSSNRDATLVPFLAARRRSWALAPANVKLNCAGISKEKSISRCAVDDSWPRLLVRYFFVSCISCGVPWITCAARNVAVSFLEFVRIFFCFVPKGFHSGALSRWSVNTLACCGGKNSDGAEGKSAINFASFVIWRNNQVTR